MVYSSEVESMQHRAVNALERGDSFSFAEWPTFALHDLEFAAELWNSPKAQAAILAELDRR